MNWARQDVQQPKMNSDRTQDCCADSSGGHQFLVPNERDCFVNFKKLREAAANSWTLLVNSVKSVQRIRRQSRRAGFQSTFSNSGALNEDTSKRPLTVKSIVSHVMSYGFKNVADDILFALLVGLLLGGILYLIFPTELLDKSWAQWLSYPVMMLVSVPLYICASASTPIAAGLVAGGLSPGAALIFLMSGPATNMATISVIHSQFGARFTGIYIGGVMAVTLVFGIVVDLFLLATGWQIAVNLADDHGHAIQLLQYVSLAIFAGLVIWRFRSGALLAGWNDMTGNFHSIRVRFGGTRKSI